MARAPGEWLPLYAPAYQALQKSERQALSEFVVVWSLFEAQVLNCNATLDRMLAAIEHWHAADALAIDHIDGSWSHFVERLTDGDNVSGRFSGLRIKNLGHKNAVKDAVLAKPPEPDVKTRHRALAVIIQRIRNNLLHGEKWAYGLQDQEHNFRESSHVLMVWMDINRGHPFPEPLPG